MLFRSPAQIEDFFGDRDSHVPMDVLELDISKYDKSGGSATELVKLLGEIRQQKELQEKQAAIRKAQMLAETAFQLVGMITSPVNIFEHATEMYGPFGVPIAVAAVAAMFGAFAAAKIKAFQAINDGQVNIVTGKHSH